MDTTYAKDSWTQHVNGRGIWMSAVISFLSLVCIHYMNSRPHSTNKTTTTTPSEEKYMHYKALAKELQDIDTNIKKLHQNFQQTSNLSDSFRRLETVHSSM